MNHQLGLFGDWIAWHESLIGGGASVTRSIAGSEIRGANAVSGDPEWDSDAAGSGHTNVIASLGAIVLNPVLQDGATLTAVTFRGLCSTASTSGIRFQLFKRVISTNVITQIGANTDSGSGTTTFAVALGGLSEVINLANTLYYVRCRSSSSASTGFGDYVNAVQPTFTRVAGL